MHAPARSAAVVGTAPRKGGSGPVIGEASNNVATGAVLAESDRVVSALKLGNASGQRTLTSGVLSKMVR